MKQAFAILPVLLVLLSATAAFSEPAQLDTVFPPGGKRGTEVEVTLTGKLEPWPVRLHFSSKGLTFLPDKEKKGTGKIKIDTKAPTGPITVRAMNEEGVSAPLFFMVGDTAEIIESEEDKNTVTAAQKIDTSKLPLVINGKIPANNELDSFQLALKKGETIHLAVEGYTLRSLLDPVLQVYDSEGNRIALEHDSASHLDPRMEFTAPEDGNFIVALAAFAHPPAASVYFRGDKKAQYRLHLTRKREDLPDRLFPENPGPDSGETILKKGSSLTGTLKKPGEADQISLPAKKGDSLLLRVEAASLGFPTDPVFRLLKPDGSEIREVDDANKQNDPEYLWKVAADGDYTVEVFDRFRRGGADLRYRISASVPGADFTAVVEKSEYLLEPEKSVDIKVTIARQHGHQADLLFEIPNLPSKVKLTPPDKVPEKGGDLVLKLEAAKDAPPFQKPLQIQVFEKGENGEKTGQPKTARFSYKDDNYRGPYVLMEAPAVWLTIPPRKEEPAKEESKEKKKDA